MEKIVTIYDVQHIDVTVVSKIRIQRETKHPVVTPIANFVADIEQQRIIRIARVFEPDLPVPSHTYMRPLLSKATPTALVHGPEIMVSVNPEAPSLPRDYPRR